jgi:molybdate transport system substrate-binding protein
VKLKTLPLLVMLLALLLAGCAPQPAAATQPPAATQAAAEPAAAAETVAPAGPEPTATEAVTEAPTSAPSEPVELNVFAAASLTAAFGEIGELFETGHPGVTITYNFAGSQQLAQQINEGAPADVFASANKTQMDVVIEAGGIVTGTQQTFVRNRLVVIYPQDNPASISELKDLAKPDLKLVFAAAEVPVGQYSLDFLDKATADPAFGSTFKDDVLKNVVSYEDNVKAVLTKTALGEADAGIVYTSDIGATDQRDGEDAGKVGRLDIPNELNVIASYPIAPVLESEHAELSKAFIDLVLSPEGQDILAKYNFIPVDQE